jgi:hypothetical protein
LISLIEFTTQFEVETATRSSPSGSTIFNSVNQNIVSPSNSVTAAFSAPQLTAKLNSAQINPSINGTCLLTPSLIGAEGTPQQIEDLWR